MRRLALLSMLIVSAGTAFAHEIEGEAGIVERVSHEFVGLHHLPMTILLIVVIIAAYRVCKRHASRAH